LQAGVNGHSVIVKNIVLPQMTEDELQESFAWHAEEHIPFDISDVNLDYHVTNRSDDAIHVLLAACKRDKVANLKQAIQLAGKQPTVVDVDAFALQNCYELNYDPQARSCGGATEHRRVNHEYQHLEWRAIGLHARRDFRRKPVHVVAAKRNGPHV
jgi:Tfp pilus assembly PilM family ATPase